MTKSGIRPNPLYLLFTFHPGGKKLVISDICGDMNDVLNDIEDIPVRYRSMLFR